MTKAKFRRMRIRFWAWLESVAHDRRVEAWKGARG